MNKPEAGNQSSDGVIEEGHMIASFESVAPRAFDAGLRGHAGQDDLFVNARSTLYIVAQSRGRCVVTETGHKLRRRAGQ
jgi:hypothetical protein